MAAAHLTPDEQNTVDGFGIDHPTMKTESEIRQRRANLQAGLDVPYGIPEVDDQMSWMIDALSWVLGEDPE